MMVITTEVTSVFNYLVFCTICVCRFIVYHDPCHDADIPFLDFDLESRNFGDCDHRIAAYPCLCRDPCHRHISSCDHHGLYRPFCTYHLDHPSSHLEASNVVHDSRLDLLSNHHHDVSPVPSTPHHQKHIHGHSSPVHHSPYNDFSSPIVQLHHTHFSPNTCPVFSDFHLPSTPKRFYLYFD